MGKESKLQSEIIKWLKERGAYVIKLSAMPGVPVGAPDIIYLYEQHWGVIEVKASYDAAFQAGQQRTLQRLGEWNGDVYVAYPENWPLVKSMIAPIFL